MGVVFGKEKGREEEEKGIMKQPTTTRIVMMTALAVAMMATVSFGQSVAEVDEDILSYCDHMHLRIDSVTDQSLDVTYVKNKENVYDKTMRREGADKTKGMCLAAAEE